MAAITIVSLVWNDWNRRHIARHGVIPDEVEQVIDSTMLVKATYGGRYLAIGTTEALRVLAVVLEEEQTGIFFVVTARPASRRERSEYQAFLERSSHD